MENNIDFQYTINNPDNINCIFELNASETVWGNIVGNIANQTDLQEALNSKQDVLTAGDNIQITNGVISATDTTYTAGTGISIENGVISNTQISAIWGNIQGTLSNQTDLQNTLDLMNEQIEANHEEIGEIGQTIGTYGDIVTYNAANFATSSQGLLADTALQPNDNISELTNNAGYITNSVNNLVNYTLSSSLSTVATSGSYNDLLNKPTIPTVNNNTITFTQGGVTKGSFTLNQSSNATIALDAGGGTVDQTYDGTSPNAQSGVAIEGAGFLTSISSSDVTTALGYTPYNSSNPNGYTSNTGTVTSVNNVSPVSGNVTLTIPTDTSDLTNGAGYITSAALTNYMTTNTSQTITGSKGITGASLTTDDVIILDGSNSRIVGTVSNNTRGIIRLTSGDEVEIGDTSSTVNIKGSATRPTYNGADLALLSDAGGSAPSNMVTTDTQQTISGNKTFSGRLRKSFDSYNELEIGTNAGYYSIIFFSGNGNIPWHISGSGYTGATLTIDGFYTTTLQAGNNSDSYLRLAEDSLIFHKSDNTSIDLLAGGGGTVDQTYDGTSTNAQSGVAIEGELANYQTTSNLVTSISSSSTDAQYPSAKCVYDIVGDIESILHNINSGS